MSNDPMLVLHVEDNPIDADLTRLALERAGFQVVSVASLAEAWRALDGAERFDALLADLHLADGSGFELLTAVRARNLSLAVVVLTGSGDERSAIAALKAGADDYLVKRDDHLRELPAILESAVAHAAHQSVHRRPIRVLYAEHSAMDVDLTRRHLERHAPHVRIEAVETGEEALESLNSNGLYDVLLLDYRLSGLNAIEILRRVRDGDGAPQLPVVLVTGQGDEGTVVQALRLGATDYVVKRSGYLHELASVLESAHHREQLTRRLLALRQSESARRLSERALESISQGVFLTDRSQRVIYVNAALQAITGYDEFELLEMPCTFLCGSRTDPEAARRLKEALDAARSYADVIESDRKDGSSFWNELTLTPVVDADGKLTHFVGVVHDVSSQRLLQEQFRQAQKMEAVGQLSGGIAHDFNNLLTVISGHIGLLESRGLVTPEIADSIHEIAQAASRAATLTRQLLTFSRKQVMQTRVLDVGEAVEQMVKMLERLVGEDVRIHLRREAAHALVRADQGMLEQVLLNLAVNARDAMPAGGRVDIAVDIVQASELAARGLSTDDLTDEPPPQRFVRLSVSDTGVGVAPELREKIFEPFFTTKDVGKGTGLGLAMVYGIARQHGGTCAVLSEVGKGATFEVFLPAVEEGEAATAPAASVEPAAGQSGGGETVLLVEDDASVAWLIRLTLETAGYSVLAAASGVEALKLWREHANTIDVLLTDFVMPDGMTGRELAHQLLAERRGLPVVYTSGYSAEVAGRDLGDHGPGMQFLAKPFSRSTLLQTVRKAIDA
jgi:PAS domain S-box-containing protein